MFGEMEDNVRIINPIWMFFVKFFQITFVFLFIHDITLILHTCLNSILFLLYCWLFDDFALVLGPASEKDKNNSFQLVSWKVKLFLNQIFNHFYDIC